MLYERHRNETENIVALACATSLPPWWPLKLLTIAFCYRKNRPISIAIWHWLWTMFR